MADERGAWGNQLEFILTCVGYAVGLGNVWRFPYLCYTHGGGAFLVPYVIMLLGVGLPIFFFELSFGQFASLGPITIWEISPLFKGIGFAMVSVSWLIGLSYIIVITWAVYYFCASMTTDLPFADCENHWNTVRCITASDILGLNQNTTLRDIYLEDLGLTDINQLTSPSEEFYFREVIQLSSGIEESGDVIWQLALCLMLCWLLIFLVLLKGIETLGKVVYFVATFPYIMMTILIIRGVTLDGAGTGLEFYLKPEADGLSSGDAWRDAATQIFYSLSACSGGLIAMASYNPFHNNCLRDSFLVPLINCCTSVYSGFAIFSVLGYIADAKGVDVDEVADQGPGLVFVVYPEALSEMPVSTLWSILFFFMLITLGFSSQFSIMESIFVAIMDEFPGLLRKNKLRPIMMRGILCTVFFLITLPMVTEGGFYLFDTVDSYVSGFPLLFVGLFEITSVMYVYGYNNFCEDCEMMLGRRPPIYFKACWLVITPVLLLFVIIYSCVDYSDPQVGDYVFPHWGVALGWMIVAFTLFWIPTLATIRLIMTGGFSAANIKKQCHCTSKWGPAHAEDRTGKYADEEKGFKEKNGAINRAFEM